MSTVKKYLNILDYAISVLLRRRLKNCGILIVFAAVIFLLASFQLITTTLKQNAKAVLSTAPDITVQQMSAGRQVSIAEDAEVSLRELFGITAVRKRIWGYYFDEKNGANYTVIGLDMADVGPGVAESLEIGRLPEKKGEVVLASAVVRSMQLGNRKHFSLFRPDLTLKSLMTVGTFQQSTALVTDDIIYMTRADAADLFAVNPGNITDFLVDVSNPAEIDTVARKISDTLPGTRVITRSQMQRTYDVVFGWRSGVGSVCLLTSLFAFVILAWDRASGLSPEELKEMGILKITGWQTTDLMILRFYESSVVCLLSFLIGYSAAWFHIAWGDGYLFRPVLLGWSILKPSYHLSPLFHATDVLLILSCSVIPYLAATIVPAWKSAMVRPDTVI